MCIIGIFYISVTICYMHLSCRNKKNICLLTYFV